MEDIANMLYRFVSSFFQWALIYSLFIGIGSGFIWVITLGRYPNKRMLIKHDTEIFFLGIGVVIGLLYLAYFISIWQA